jgi:glucose/arabinose dehydrogenase
MFPPASRSGRLAWVTSLLVFVLMFGPAHAWAQARKKSTKKESPSFSIPKLATEVAFPSLRFDRPVALAYPDDGSKLLFVVEQHKANIFSFPNEPRTSDKKLFLELPDQINRGNEEGLLGLAFHPKYKENGTFYVYYSARDDGPVTRRSVVSRFRVSKDDPRMADPRSEERIWVSEPDRWENHNGGCIEFGPDGYLYISLGDGGAAADPLSTGQNPRDWFASILRIDVDHPADGMAYGIPNDNPKLRDAERYGHWAPEVYAIGLRNVWKFTFDRETGRLWAGDVGQDLWEMVHVIENGGNYGWSIKEAFHPFQPGRRQRADRGSPFTPPVIEYAHSVGKSITGGYVYRGKDLPSLVGVYVYADFETGHIWGLREEGGKAVQNRDLIDLTSSPKLNVAAFGEDAEGELYILAFDGRIYKLVLTL